MISPIIHDESRGEIMISFKGAHFKEDIILTGVRWYMVDPSSARQVEELVQERRGSVDHATLNCWALKYSPQLEAAFHRRRRPVWMSWRMDATYIRSRERRVIERRQNRCDARISVRRRRRS
jgi:transposase-like protein